ncbi:MAG: rRNA maturation RNase YbeY [Chloroflexota bacterium]|nr:MAG: rRNA maturation RNase YbeY [Anaerolineaceae bacterium 4572_5.2]RLD06745.1 MAG: rRNA maturation RNase YbeY [Chloroflexota bacterium]
MIRFEIDKQFQEQVNETLLKQTTLTALKHLNITESIGLTILIVGNGEIQALNRQYRGVDAPTDVLSFSAGDIDPDTGERYLGDVLISYPKAAIQAQAQGHPAAAELQLLIIHGVLHLLGHNHATEEEKSLMWGLQSEILAKLDLNIEVERNE